MGLISNILRSLYHWACRNTRTFSYSVLGLAIVMALGLVLGKTYQHLDKDPDRGAYAFKNGAFGDSHATPIYLDQGWNESDSLWFYNTTQGSNLLPYDLFMVLERAGSELLLRSDKVIDEYRYLPQKATFFNPDALPVGFVKDHYDGNEYVGLTCAACHTGQLNYQGQAIRIDGGPAMADMTGYLNEMVEALKETIHNDVKRQRFVKNVIALDNDYGKPEEVIKDLELWFDIRRQYNIVNHSNIEYGYARLDAFGRIYNRVLQYVINRDQLKSHLSTARKPLSAEQTLDSTVPGSTTRILTPEQVEKVLVGINETVVSRDQFLNIINRLLSSEEGYPNLGFDDLLRLRDSVFNEPNAPVSYPFLWDTAHSDYVQWNGIASNASAGPIGRNVGEVLGVFASIDWTQEKASTFSLPAIVSGQKNKHSVIKFKTSTDLINLERLESQLKSLKSPQWPESILGKIDSVKMQQGQLLYAEYCQSCHEVIDRNNWDRVNVGQMSAIQNVKTDPAMAENSVMYSGSAGNFTHTYQDLDIGKIIIEEQAPVAVILTAATSGVVATPDADKNIIRRLLDWLYVMAMSFFQNDIEASVRNGDYTPNTTAQPFNALLSYKARALNGIWATAPYLHNGSVPTMYDLLLPVKREGDPDTGEYRPNSFTVASREFDPDKMGFEYELCEQTTAEKGFCFTTNQRGNLNSGHEYAAGITPRADGKKLPPMNRVQRLQLLEYIKSL